MIKLAKKLSLFSILILLINCQSNTSNSTTSVTTVSTANAWTAEDKNNTYELILTQKDDLNANFSEKITQKSNKSVQNIGGFITYNNDTKISIWNLSKPTTAVVKMTYITSNNGNTYEYTVTESNSDLFNVKQKITYIKNNP